MKSEGKQPGRRRRALRNIGFFLLGGVVVYLVAGCAMQRSIIWPTGMMAPAPAKAHPGVGGQVLTLETDEGSVEAWLLMGDGVSEQTPGPLLIFAHGNAELIDDWRDTLRPYRQRGITVLLPEFRGYGRSAGSPSEKKITADFVAFHDLVTARPEVDGEKVIIHGRSIGGGIAAQLAGQRPPAGLILESTFTSMSDMAWGLGYPGFFIMDSMKSIDVVREYPGPVLVMHGTADQIIPFSHGEALAEAAADAEFVQFNIGHNDRPDSQGYWDAVDRLLKRAGVAPEATQD